jgi:hypothetical protein
VSGRRAGVEDVGRFSVVVVHHESVDVLEASNGDPRASRHASVMQRVILFLVPDPE